MTLYTIKERRGTAAAWALANTVLAEGQWAVELDTGKAKLGDGATAWNDLSYYIDETLVLALINANVHKPVNAQSGTSYTLLLADAGKFVTMDNVASCTLTIPPGVFPVSTVIEGANLGVGPLTLTPGIGIELNGNPGLVIAEPYGAFGLKQIATGIWLAYGKLSETE